MANTGMIDDNGNPIAAPESGTYVNDWGFTTNNDGSPVYASLNNPADIANFRQNYTELSGKTDQQIRDYVGPDNFQMGGNRTGTNPLTHIVNNEGVTGLSGLIGDVKGFLTDTGGAGALIAAPFAAAGAGELFGAGAGAAEGASAVDPWAAQGAWESFGSTGGEAGGLVGGGEGGGDLFLDELTDTAGNTYNNVPVNTGNPLDYATSVDPATGRPKEGGADTIQGLNGFTGIQAPADETGAFDIGGSSGFGGSTPLSLDASVTGAESFPAGGGGGSGNDFASGEAEDFGVNDSELEARRVAAQRAANQSGELKLPNTPPVPPTGKKTEMQTALDTAMKYGPLAIGALGAKSGNQAGQKAAAQIRGIPAAQQAIGNQLLQQYQSGTLNANDAASIKQFTQDAIAKSRAYFAKAGLSDSTAAVDAEKAIAERAAAMQSQMLQGYLTQGMTALNITDQYQLAAVQAELQGSKDATKATTDFLNAYGQWLRGSGTMTGTEKAAA